MTPSGLRPLLATALFIVALTAAAPLSAQTREDADALYAENRWDEAAEAYRAVLSATPDDGAAWFGLAQSEHQRARHADAEKAYLEALQAGFEPALRVHYHLARAYMSMDERDRALQQVEAMGAIGGISHRMILAVPELEPLIGDPRFNAVIERLTPCNTERYRDFDFWLGEWDVTPANAPAATARNVITSIQDGCAVLERYETQGGFTGISLNFYDSATGLWHQSWMSNGGGAVYLEGGIEDGVMVMTDAGLPVSQATGTVSRTTWTPLDDGRVRQHWESSRDGGETWTTVFDGFYSRVQP